MENYKTEEEQLEALKNWWKENGQSLVVGVAIALAGFFGWQAWDGHQQSQDEQASALYQSLLDADGQAQLDPNQTDTAKHLAAKIKSDHGSSAYAALAGLFNAKYAAKDGDWAAAETELAWVLEQKPSEAMALQTRYRLAQVQLELGKHSEALNSLSVADAAGFAGRFAELRGDVQLAAGDNVAALAAYRSAQALYLAAPGSGGGELLQQKIQSLELSTASDAAENVEKEA